MSPVLAGVGLLVVLLLLFCMILRDTAKAFFADWIRAAIFIIVIVTCILAWWPAKFGR